MVPLYFRSVIECLERHAAEQPDAEAFVFLRGKHLNATTMTYATLWRRVNDIAAYLYSQGCQAGDRILLIYPSGLEYVEAFFGCLRARMIAVPIYPPASHRNLGRLRTVLKDCEPHVVLTDHASGARLLSWLANETLDAKDIPFCFLDQIPQEDAVATKLTLPSAHDIAFLQYTSGATGEPKGVVISHSNISSNARMISLALGRDKPGVTFSWLPLYHDMGLIGDVIQSVYWGLPCILMSPFTFVQHPATWLQAISKYRVWRSGGPNFAYELCTKKISPTQIEALDLSSWKVAFCGSEPIRLQSLYRFSERFSPAGFDKRSLAPCYGMAEATLFISGSAKTGKLRSHALLSAEPDGPRFAGCGPVGDGLDVQIVDPATSLPCAAGVVGEIWVRGPNIAQGYWNNPTATALNFHAHLRTAAPNGPYMRTGDLGFFKDGELVLTGRLKEVLIIAGRNLYPHELEATVEAQSPALRPTSTAAVALHGEKADALGIVAEIERTFRDSTELPKLAGLITSALISRHGVAPKQIAFLRPGGQLKTTSGKIRRVEIRRRLVEGTLDVLFEWPLVKTPAWRDASEAVRVDDAVTADNAL